MADAFAQAKICVVLSGYSIAKCCHNKVVAAVACAKPELYYNNK